MKKSGHFYKLVLGFALMLLASGNSMAKDIAGVKLAEQAKIAGVEKTLVLNGAGIRYKFFFKIYVDALYLPTKQDKADKILRTSQANRIAMHFLYDEVEKKKLVNAWLEGFEENVDSKTFNALKERLDTFNEMFSDLHEGDVVLLDYNPEIGTQVTIKGESKGVIKGADFNQALLAVWLGDEPITEELKDAMLGIEEE